MGYHRTSFVPLDHVMKSCLILLNFVSRRYVRFGFHPSKASSGLEIARHQMHAAGYSLALTLSVSQVVRPSESIECHCDLWGSLFRRWFYHSHVTNQGWALANPSVFGWSRRVGYGCTTYQAIPIDPYSTDNENVEQSSFPTHRKVSLSNRSRLIIFSRRLSVINPCSFWKGAQDTSLLFSACNVLKWQSAPISN